jgi:hypothetical protein
LREARVRSLLGNTLRLRYSEGVAELATKPGRIYRFDGDLAQQKSGFTRGGKTETSVRRALMRGAE